MLDLPSALIGKIFIDLVVDLFLNTDDKFFNEFVMMFSALIENDSSENLQRASSNSKSSTIEIKLCSV